MQKSGLMENLFINTEMKHTPKFMKSPGSCWHIVDIPANSDTKKH